MRFIPPEIISRKKNSKNILHLKRERRQKASLCAFASVLFLMNDDDKTKTTIYQKKEFK